MIVLHYTAQTGPDACERLCDPVLYKVSSHYLVYEDGGIDQLVPEAPARTARRRVAVGGRARQQLALGRGSRS